MEVTFEQALVLEDQHRLRWSSVLACDACTSTLSPVVAIDVNRLGPCGYQLCVVRFTTGCQRFARVC